MKVKVSENGLFIYDVDNMRPIMFQEKEKKIIKILILI